jgi:hypothetical protein
VDAYTVARVELRRSTELLAFKFFDNCAHGKKRRRAGTAAAAREW